MRRSGVRIPSAPQKENGPDTLFVRSIFVLSMYGGGFGRRSEERATRLPSAPQRREGPTRFSWVLLCVPRPSSRAPGVPPSVETLQSGPGRPGCRGGAGGGSSSRSTRPPAGAATGRTWSSWSRRPPVRPAGPPGSASAPRRSRGPARRAAPTTAAGPAGNERGVCQAASRRAARVAPHRPAAPVTHRRSTATRTDA